jgi:hypothetical protein
LGAAWLLKSDEKLKTDIVQLENPIEDLLKIRGVSFKWADGGTPDMGVIAQEVEKVFPDLVVDMGGHKMVRYQGLIAVLIEAVKHLSRRIEQ